MLFGAHPNLTIFFPNSLLHSLTVYHQTIIQKKPLDIIAHLLHPFTYQLTSLMIRDKIKIKKTSLMRGSNPRR